MVDRKAADNESELTNLNRSVGEYYMFVSGEKAVGPIGRGSVV